MRYTEINGGNSYPYPNHNIDPAKKNGEWCMAYAKAAYYDFTFVFPKGVFASNMGTYEKNRMYALGKQPISIYKKLLGVDNATDNTWLTVDWTVRPIVSHYRDKAIEELMSEDYSVVCTPIDMLAKTRFAQYYSDLKAKLAVRQLMVQQFPEMASHPLIQLQTGEPLDLEELEMRVELGEQFNRSKDAEMAIELGFYENNYKATRRAIYEDLFDYGVAGYKEWLGDDNKAKFRRCDPNNVVINFCKEKTFSGMVHAGELIDVPLIELATITDEEGKLMFTEADLQEFASTLAGKFGNPTTLGNTNWFKPYDKFKCKVFDIEFYTYNEYSFRSVTDENGNKDSRKADYGRGRKSDKYKRKKIQYVYKCKWIVGTDKFYDWGMCYDQKRPSDIKKKAKTRLSYQFCAYNFDNMKAQSFMDRLIPFLDDYQLTILKIQNWKNRAVPSGWWINLDMLENVALNKGGANMEPRELLQMYFDTGIMVGRGLQGSGEPFPGNIQPVIPIENSNTQELVGFHNDLLATVQSIEKMTGYNDVTTGNPNPKTLVPGYEIAVASTKMALAPMAFAEEFLCLNLAEDVLCRMQQGLKKGGISGYAPAINTNSLRFIELDREMSIRDYGIELQRKTTDDQKMWLLNQMQSDIENGFLDSSDAVMLVNTHNAKQAQAIWAHRVRKAKEKAQEYELQKLQMQSDGNAQVAAAAEQAKQDTLWIEIQGDLRKEEMRIMGELKKEEMRLNAQIQIKAMELGVKDKMNMDMADAKRDVAQATGEAKIISSGIDQDSKLIATEIAGEYAKEKQEIANKKPKSTNTK